MPLKTETPDDPGINLTPMVDVVFLLVIFFMVGTQFAETEKYHEINLPSVTDARPITGLPDEIVINVTREGTVLVGASLRRSSNSMSRCKRHTTDMPIKSLSFGVMKRRSTGRS